MARPRTKIRVARRTGWRAIASSLVAATLAASAGPMLAAPPAAVAPTTGPVITIVRQSHAAPPARESKEWISGAIAKDTTSERVLDLGGALLLAGVDNPTINLAEERVREALAGQLAARSLLLPSINVGGNFRLHRGVLQDDPGFLRNPNLQSLYLGAGAGAVGAGNVAVPGVWLFTHLGNAAFEPRAAGQRVAARNADSLAARNAVLLDVASAYLELVGSEERLGLLRRAESEVREIVRLTSAFARTGAGTEADANRAAANGELVRRQVREGEGAVTAAAARLARLVNVDPSLLLRTPGGTVEPLRLVDERSDPESLVAGAMLARPELAAMSAAVQEAETRVRQEHTRPWLPLVAAGYSSGAFGGGSNQVASDFGPLMARADVSLMAVWNVQNLGAGNLARVRQARAAVGGAMAGYEAAVNQVRREVMAARAACLTASLQIEVARRSLSAAEEGYRLEADRIKEGAGRPIEALDSFRQLLDARLELVRATVAFDVAQFQLFVAIGNTPAGAPGQWCGGATTPRAWIRPPLTEAGR